MHRRIGSFIDLQGAARVALALAAVAALATASPAEWVDLTPDLTGLTVLEDSGDRIVIEATIDGFERGSIDIDGVAHATFMIPGETVHMTPGAPQVPTLRHSVLLPDNLAMTVRVLERETTTYASGPVAPSKGHLKRNIDPATVPFQFGPSYDASVPFPEEPATLGEPYILRDFRGAVLEINPMRYLPTTQEVEVTTRIVVEVVPGPGEVINGIDRAEPPRFVDGEFHPLYTSVFENYDVEYYVPLHEVGRCVVVSDPTLWAAAERLAEWKLQKGIPTTMVDVTTLNRDPDLLKSWIQDYFDEPEGLTYVILVGDVAQVPTLYGDIDNAPSDVQYSRTVGTDYYPDLFVSRLTAQNLAQADYVVEKMIKYELDPFMDEPAWFSKATGIASAESGGTGLTDCQRVQLLEAMLLDYTYTEVDRICDPTATKAMIFAALNAGSTLVNYIGHGSGTSWGTTGFNVTDIKNLANGWKSCFLLDVACSNGDYTMNESFGEAWLRAGAMDTPKAGLGTYGSSLVCSWVPPCIMQNEANRLLTEEITHSVGGICMGGIMRVLDTEGYDGRVLFEEYNILGDCSIPLRTTMPAALTVEHPGTYYLDEPTYDVTVTGVEDALVALYAGGVLYGSGYTDASGFASIGLDVLPTEPMTLTLTVTAYNRQTFVTDVPVEWASLAEMLVDHVDVTDLGDATLNGQIESGESAELLLTLRNDGIEAATGINAVLSAITEGVTVTQPLANYGTVNPGEMATGDQPYVISVAPNVADGTVLVFDLAIDADAGQWDDGVQLTAHAPVLAVKWFHVDDASGDNDNRFDGGETVGLLLQLVNQGSGDAADLNATLSSGSISITIQPGSSTLDGLLSGGEGPLDPRFIATALPSTLEREYLFNAQVSGGNGFQQRVAFPVPVGGFFENVEHGEGAWLHAQMGGLADEWHLSGQRNASPLGASSWKFGSAAADPYANDGDGVLVSPVLSLNGNATLKFAHWIDAETGSGPGLAHDGGLLEISLSGGDWTPLVPEAGYPYQLEGGTSLPAGTGVFSGQSDWQTVVVDLEGFTGNAQIRFRFVSDSATGGEGWYIDDVSVLGLEQTTSVDILPNEVGLQLAVAPNPMRGSAQLAFQLPDAQSVDLGIYDASGRRIATLASGRHEAGVHTVEWSREANLESGVYFARLRSGAEARTQRIVLVN